jgi:DNA primase
MAGLIPKRTIEDIRFNTDIAELIGGYINLKKVGPTLKALCPFHKEKTPSFTVNHQKQFFHCFGCHVGGDVFSFVMKYEGVDYPTAIKILAERAGIAIEYEKGSQPTEDKAALYKIHEEVAKFYRRCLLQMDNAKAARDYLAKREISEETAQDFMIGYAPLGWHNIEKWGQKNNFSLAQLEKSGLAIIKEEGSKRNVYDRFRDRLMFPIRDEQKRVIGFSGRILVKDDKGAKYVNSPETPLFHKSRILYGLEKARRNIVDVRAAIICEGQIDVIRCHQAGFKNAVASQGTAFTQEHATILHRYADSVTIVFDPDTAGQNASIKTADIFMDAGLAVKVAMLPAGEDPDSLIMKQGADAFKDVLKKATSAIGFQVATLSHREDIHSEVGIMRISDAVLTTISRSPNAVQRSMMLQEAAEHLEIPVSSLEEDLQKKIRRNQRYKRNDAPIYSSGSTEESNNTAQTKSEIIYFEDRTLCEHLVDANKDILEVIEKYLPLTMLCSQLCINMADACLQAAGDQDKLQEIIRETSHDNPEFSEFAASIQMAPPKMVGKEFAAIDAVKGLILAIWRREMKKKRAALKPDQAELRSHITYDLKSLNNWEQGTIIIEREILQLSEDEEEF